MSHVFISHAGEDRVTSLRLCRLLESKSIPTWVSFRDIKAGVHWDEEIERALGTADAVIVLATPSAVNSRYVRAEVEGALSEQLTVVPVVLGEVTMPLRWKALQFVSWNGDADETVATQIERALPPAAHNTFITHLEDPTKEHELRNLILNHTEWLPIESGMHLDYRYLQRAETSAGNTLDCFAARADSLGPRAYLYYLGSPYAEPFGASGVLTESTRGLVDRIKRDADWFVNRMPDQHALAPNNFLCYEEQRRPVPATTQYATFTIYALAGRRRHYERDASNRARQSVARSLEMESPYQCRAVEFISYDRVSESVKVESQGWAARYRKWLRESEVRKEPGS